MKKEPDFYRPSWIEVDLDAVALNTEKLKSYLRKTELLAVVKADAYGLGAVPVARTVMAHGADCLGVVTLDEAIELRRGGIEARILNMGPIFADQVEYIIHYHLEQMVFTLEVAGALSRAAAAKGAVARVHIKVDTGMNRYGVPWPEAVDTILRIGRLPNLKVTGVMTHFSMSDALDKSFALLQMHRFKQIQSLLQAKGLHIPTWHLCNSGGTLDLPQAHMDMVRVGLMLYGYFPSSEVRRPFELRPAMSVKTRIATVRSIHRGDTVGYGRRYMAEQDERIAVLPIGYADGYDRGLGNIGEVILHGRRVPIVGGLCMDACFIKIGAVPEAKVGDVVTIMGRESVEEITPHDIARLIQSVSYEVMSRFGRRLPRVYFRGGRVESVYYDLLD